VVAVPLVTQRNLDASADGAGRDCPRGGRRVDATGSMVVIDTHLARGASNGGFTFADCGGPYGAAKGAERVVAVEVTGLTVGALVVPACTHENRTSELMLEP
jgi:putative transposase